MEKLLSGDISMDSPVSKVHEHFKVSKSILIVIQKCLSKLKLYFILSVLIQLSNMSRLSQRSARRRESCKTMTTYLWLIMAFIDVHFTDRISSTILPLNNKLCTLMLFHFVFTTTKQNIWIFSNFFSYISVEKWNVKRLNIA